MAFVSSLSVRTSAFSPRSAPAVCRSAPPAARVAKRVSLTMGLGEDGLDEDLQVAQTCIDDGCTVESVQEILTRLERRRAVLSLEVDKIEQVMSILAKENLGGDRSLIADAMAAAVSIFAKANDDYPTVGGSEAINAWTLDPLKKQPKL